MSVSEEIAQLAKQVSGFEVRIAASRQERKHASIDRADVVHRFLVLSEMLRIVDVLTNTLKNVLADELLALAIDSTQEKAQGSDS